MISRALNKKDTDRAKRKDGGGRKAAKTLYSRGAKAFPSVTDHFAGRFVIYFTGNFSSRISVTSQ